ncbi:hypothetical protein M5689_000284 [Euphorbia peplus]|nr:hypothetical protein M5689_000284 [Euphorbia peplus]
MAPKKDTGKVPQISESDDNQGQDRNTNEEIPYGMVANAVNQFEGANRASPLEEALQKNNTMMGKLEKCITEMVQVMKEHVVTRVPIAHEQIGDLIGEISKIPEICA